MNFNPLIIVGRNDSMAACIITTKNSSFCRGFKKCCYMSHIVAPFRTTPIYEIYCSKPLDHRNRYSLLRWNTSGPDLLDLSTVTVDLIIFSFLQSTALKTLEEVTKMKEINIGRSCNLVEYCLEEASRSSCHNMLQQTIHSPNKLLLSFFSFPFFFFLEIVDQLICSWGQSFFFL